MLLNYFKKYTVLVLESGLLCFVNNMVIAFIIIPLLLLNIRKLLKFCVLYFPVEICILIFIFAILAIKVVHDYYK